MKIGLLIIYGLLLAAVIIALFYFFDVLNFKVFINGLIAQIPTNDLLPQLGTFVKDNVATIVSVAIPTVIGLVTYVKYKAELTAKKELLELQTELQAKTLNAEALVENTKVTASNTISNLESELAGFKGDTTAEQLQTRLTGLITSNESLQSQIEALQKQPAQLAEQLWAKSGGQVIDVAGVQYKIIEKEILNVK